MTRIKLFKVDEMKDGTIRLQSQLLVGRDSVDFIMQGGVLKRYEYGDKGFSFYETNVPYEIVKNIKEMALQQL